MLAAFLTKPAECIGRMDGQELWHAAFLDASYIDIYAKLYIGLSALAQVKVFLFEASNFQDGHLQLAPSHQPVFKAQIVQPDVPHPRIIPYENHFAKS